MSPYRRDLVVIGGSSGSLNVLQELLGNFPAELSASVFVVIHGGPDAETRSCSVLQNYCAMPVRYAEDGQAIEPGSVTLAIPDQHMLLGNRHVHLRRGPRENNFRPAIDPLFRSAAIYHGTRTIAAVLSGLLDDGAAGLRAVWRTGGECLVQDPETAEYPEMPDAALRAVPEAVTLPSDELGPAIVHRVGEQVSAPHGAPPDDVLIELKIAGLDGASIDHENELGRLSPYNCPDCNGVLWEIEDRPMVRYRCHTGHAYSLDALSASQERALEASLYNTLRAHRGRIHLLRRLAEQAKRNTDRQRYLARAEDYERDAENLQRLLLKDEPAEL